ncbi:immunity 22 family protein [Terrilactibacillus sp. S3-3]|nr:immunity 22 family protein [Terrilactibacillus sp. S3-3]
MEKKGMVSLWLGNCLNKEELEKYVDLTYDDEGESVPSKFLLDFKIDMNEIDEDFIEKAVLNNPSNDLTKLLNGSSYEEVIVPKNY